MAIADRTHRPRVLSKFPRRPSKLAQSAPTSQASRQRVNGGAPAPYRDVTNRGAGREDGLRRGCPEEFGGARLLLSDIRAAFLLANEARYRAIERVLGVPRDRANLVTVIALGMLLQATHEKTEQLLRGPGAPTRTDAVLGAAVLRELLYEVGRPPSRGSPWSDALVIVALLGGLSRPAARRSIRGIRASIQQIGAAFNDRYGHPRTLGSSDEGRG